MAGYTVERSITVDAPWLQVHRLVNDFHLWTLWSPWEDVDPELKRTYTGADRGVGARYAWSGNRKAGVGEMEITGSTPERIDIALRFLKPIKAHNPTSFTFEDLDGAIRVTWTMSGEHKGLMGVMGRLMSMDRMIGPDFDKGLARLKSVSEQGGA